MVLPAKKPATYADLQALPDHVVGEIIDGELVVSPRPAGPLLRRAPTVTRRRTPGGRNPDQTAFRSDRAPTRRPEWRPSAQHRQFRQALAARHSVTRVC